MRVGSLCSGYAGIELGLESVFPADLAFTAEIDPGASRILKHRFPHVPNLGDLTHIEWDTVGPVDVLTAGFPCQDVSQAGGRAGLRANTRTGVWYQVARAIDALQPELVILENVRGLLSASADSAVEQCPWCLGEDGNEHPLRALGAVLGDLADLGFDAEWVTVPASAVGAPHRRDRVFVAAWPAGNPPDFAWDERPDGNSENQGRWRREAPGNPGGAPGAAADPEWGEFQRRRGPAVVGGPPSGQPGEGDQRKRTGDAPVGGGADAPYPEHSGLEGCPRCGFTGTRRPSGVPAGGDPAYSAVARLERLLADAAAGRPPWPETWPWGHGPGGGRGAAADAEHDGFPEPAPGGSGESTEPGQRGSWRAAEEPAGIGGERVEWGQYEPAIRRWESVLNRPAPRPAEPTGRDGGLRLSPRFVEWMQGLPEGWVTEVPRLTRTEQLKALGNGVVPQQAAYAIQSLLPSRDMCGVV